MVGLAVAGVGAAVAVIRRSLRRRRALVRKVARRLDGTVRESSLTDGFGARAGVTVPIDGIDVSFAIGDINNATTCKWTAAVSHRAMPQFHVIRTWIGASIGNRLGMPDRELGVHADFDRHFIVRSPTPRMLTRVWSEWAMDEMYHRFPRGTAKSTGKQITLEILEEVDDDVHIEAGMRLVAALAGADVFGMTALRDLDGAQELSSNGGFPSVRFMGAADVVVGPVSKRKHLLTRARAPAASRSDHVIVRARDGDLSDLHDEAHLTAEQRRLAETLGTAEIEWTLRELRITWSAVETDPKRLRAGIALLRSLAAPAKQGIFR